MPTIFTRIIQGDLPGRFVWQDDRVVAFLTISPVKPGHTLVVPREEIDHWIDMEQDLARHVMDVCVAVGQAIQQAFGPLRVGQSIVGLEVPHVHVHLIPINEMADINFANADPDPDPAELDAAAERIRTALRELGHAQVSD
jgi:histidine triad (HIT) family protein